MFKKILLTLGFVAACAPAHADIIQINVPCDPQPEVFKVMEQYKNGLLLQGTGTITGKDGKNFTSVAQIFTNQDTGSLAVILSFPNDDGPIMSCLIIAGADWEPYGGPQPWDNIPTWDKQEEEL
tara:strand:+ start:967 stop:1338 length:372 start_codon:yes stop_codon:yes gene_type:complete